MQYIHVKNIDKYQPGYTDRKHIWAKIYWEIFIDPHYQTLNETDRHRFIGLIVFEVYTQKPVPLTPVNMALMGWNIKKRPISLTLQMLHTFVITRNESVTQSRVEESRVEESRVEENRVDKVSQIPPLKQHLKDYFKELKSSEAEAFADYYASKGWKVGSVAMKDWKASARNWVRRSDKPKVIETPTRHNPNVPKGKTVKELVDLTRNIGKKL